MATIVPYKDGFRAIVRRVGYPFQSKVLPTRAQAEKWARSVESEMDKRAYIAPSRTKVRKIFEKFRDEVCPTRKGEKWEKTRINRLIRTCAWVDKNIDDLDRFDIQAWRDMRLKEVSGASVNREMNLISGIISHAMQEWEIQLRVNPVHEAKRPPKGKPLNRRVKQEEIDNLLEVTQFDVSKPPRKGYGAVRDSIPWVFLLAIETGLRIGELLELDWQHVHLDEQWLCVVDSKNGDSRVVPLTEDAEFLLRSLNGEEGKVFPVNKGSFDVSFRKWRDAQGFEGLKFHTTRHEGASRMAKKLGHLELAKVLGHRDPRSTMVYYNPTPSELVEKLRRK